MRIPAHIICNEPLVLVTATGEFLPTFLRDLGNARKQCTCYVMLWWDGVSVFDEILSVQRETEIRFPFIKLIWLANSDTEHTIFGKHGLNTIFCNHNAFVDDNVFTPIERSDKRFDAIYNAAFRKYKRHNLASEVRNLGLIGYVHPDESSGLEQVRAECPNAIILNDVGSDGSLSWITPHQVAALISSAKTGLCLSQLEGAMYASMEYLLCDVPVISTPSRGGRDQFFGNGNARIVDANSECISQAVEESSARETTGVRKHTLALVVQHRERFIESLRLHVPEQCLHPISDSLWSSAFTNRMFKWMTMDAIIPFEA